MIVKCINIGTTKNLTANKEYEVLNELDDNYYLILNDSGKEKRYSKKLFDKEQNIFDFDINNVEISVNGDIASVNYNIGDRSVELHRFNNPITREGTVISCGVGQTYNLNLLLDNMVESIYVDEDMERAGLTINGYDISAVVKKVLYELIVEETGIYRFRLVSTNIGDNPELDSFCEKFNFDVLQYFEAEASGTFTGVNPNSENEITLWVFDDCIDQ